jgi:phytoene desaturase
MAPSSLLFYVGLDKKLSGVVHHTLFFDRDFGQHAEEIYTTKTWPSAPLFYTSITSVSDPDVAPAGHENLVLLIPIATDLDDTPEIRERYFDEIIGRMELLTGQSIRPHVVYKRSYCIQDFKADYHSFGGNAYGLANTLMQTAFLKPKMKSAKVDNLYFTGQLTVPGPGVPPALISGQIAAREVMKRHV